MDDVRFCKNCGRMIQPGEKFCANCGTPVDEASHGAVPNDSTQYNSTASPKILRPSSNPRPVENSGTDVAGFVCGLLSLILGSLPLAIIGMVLSFRGKGETKLGKAGFIISTIGLFVSVVSCIIMIFYFLGYIHMG